MPDLCLNKAAWTRDRSIQPSRVTHQVTGGARHFVGERTSMRLEIPNSSLGNHHQHAISVERSDFTVIDALLKQLGRLINVSRTQNDRRRFAFLVAVPP